jgi:hypothetical protein
VAQVSPPIESATGYGLYVLFIIVCVVAFIFVRYALGKLTILIIVIKLMYVGSKTNCFPVETMGRSLEEMAELFGLDGSDIKGEESDAATQGKKVSLERQCGYGKYDWLTQCDM